jgi:hypothetical protein
VYNIYLSSFSKVNDYSEKHFSAYYLCLEGEQVPFKINSMKKNIQETVKIKFTTQPILFLKFCYNSLLFHCYLQWMFLQNTIIQNIKKPQSSNNRENPLYFHCNISIKALLIHCYLAKVILYPKMPFYISKCNTINTSLWEHHEHTLSLPRARFINDIIPAMIRASPHVNIHQLNDEGT